MTAEFIYTCYKLGRFYPPDRQVLADISLSFYPGAKIGVLGANGSGKSSLLKIMAGLDDGYSGEARLTPGFSVGLLAQEPQLDPKKDALGSLCFGVQLFVGRESGLALGLAGLGRHAHPLQLALQCAATS
ncbi:MAG: ATP-binding cassette domain-containing protein, partial [Actinobacteria bacterium]|nr:ATP-binding cassette domain-containing protein [Actinomycetota bacterium]